MGTHSNSTRRIARETMQVAESVERPDWVPATERLPTVGEDVQCAEGMGQVVRLLGKTGDGSRLIELELPGRPRQPFFVAASNLLVAPA